MFHINAKEKYAHDKGKSSVACLPMLLVFASVLARADEIGLITVPPMEASGIVEQPTEDLSTSTLEPIQQGNNQASQKSGNSTASPDESLAEEVPPTPSDEVLTMGSTLNLFP